MKQKPDYYAILQVSPEADPAIIKAAYYTQLKVMKKHPDLGGDHEEATRLNEAYEVLSDPVKRHAYDQHRPVLPPAARPPQAAKQTSAPSMGEEHRRAVRALFEKTFQFRFYQQQEEWHPAQFRDISLLGACIRATEKFRTHQLLEMDISQTPMVRAIAKVRWVRMLPQRFGSPIYEGGVEFERINPALFREFLKRAGLEMLL